MTSFCWQNRQTHQCSEQRVKKEAHKSSQLVFHNGQSREMVVLSINDHQTTGHHLENLKEKGSV